MPEEEVLVAARTLMELANDHSPVDHSASLRRRRPGISKSPIHGRKKSKNTEKKSRKRKLEEIGSSLLDEKVNFLNETDYKSLDGCGLEMPRKSGNKNQNTHLQNLKKQTVSVRGGINPALPGAMVTKNRELVVDPSNQLKPNPVTLNSGFSFSTICFLSAARDALANPGAEDFALALGKSFVVDDANKKHRHCAFRDINDRDVDGRSVLQAHNKGSSITGSECAQMKLPSLTTEQIIQRVRSKPGDTHVLEMKVPLQDLVRGVLRIFSSAVAPPGISSWQPLAVYEKSTKLWSWVGPVLSHLPRSDILSTSAVAWGLRSETLNKMVDSFGQWLKATEKTLEKIAGLPPPPLFLMQRTCNTQRFKDARNPKSSICTISPSCEGVRAYFRNEEALRYLIPEQVFSYTTLDAKKSTVAPLKRCSGKPSRKTRDHFILKPIRPPSFTVLCLVRDAAARLPNGMGTRSDICTLVKDSQFIIEDVLEDHIKQVVSGALDRLHYELDPCIRFDRDSRLWFYLHGDREEEDFEDGATSSTKIRTKTKS